jgi:hypothetical protein
MRVEGREPQLQLPGVDSERLEVDPHIARFDLAIELGEQEDGGYAGYLEYDTALYEAATAQRVADDFVAMLDAVVAAPDEPLAALLRRD